MDVTYYGWSRVALSHANTTVAFDMGADRGLWEMVAEKSALVLCVTHGHPDHIAALRQLLQQPEATPHVSRTHIVSSPFVINYLIKKGCPLAAGNMHAITDGESVSIADAVVVGFTWRHAPLAPPELRQKISYAAHVLAHSLAAANIALRAIGFPLQAPMLGYHITFRDGLTVLNYAEGLHHFTNQNEVEAMADNHHAEWLLCAVEPEDIHVIPDWLRILQPSSVLLYEAHRPWRELFGLPCVDLSQYGCELSQRFPKIRIIAFQQP